MIRRRSRFTRRTKSNVAFGLFLTCLFFVALGVTAATNSSLSDGSLAKIQFDQKLGTQISLDLPFRDEKGKTVLLGDCFNNKPVILILGYYGCPMLCNLVLNGLVESLQDLKSNVGKQFVLVNVSIDPGETAELANAKKKTYLKRYGREGAAAGWHFLTGEKMISKKLADEVGFYYAYDPRIHQYAHPSGVIVLTPSGRVARYFFGVNFAAKELGVALNQASANRTGSPIDQFVLLCFHYSPLTGKYGNFIMAVVRLSGATTLVGLSLAIAWAARRKRSGSHGQTEAGGARVLAQPARRQ